MQGNQIKEKLFHLLRTRTQTKQPNIQAHKKNKDTNEQTTTTTKVFTLQNSIFIK